MDLDEGTSPEAEGAFDRVATIGVLIALAATVVAGSTIWLLLTDPITVANAVENGEITPLVLRLVEIIYSALANLLDYL